MTTIEKCLALNFLDPAFEKIGIVTDAHKNSAKTNKAITIGRVAIKAIVMFGLAFVAVATLAFLASISIKGLGLAFMVGLTVATILTAHKQETSPQATFGQYMRGASSVVKETVGQ